MNKEQGMLSIEKPDRHTIHEKETSHMCLFIVIIDDTLIYQTQQME
jgi:hypothetical protein